MKKGSYMLMKNNCVEILKAVMAFLSMIYKDRALIYQVVNKAVNKIKINL